MKKRVAIIGFSSRLPSTSNNDFWKDLLEGRDLITEVNSERWEKNSFSHSNKKHPGTSYTFAAGSIGDISTFDAGFFGISPREAALMDPQQRLLLEMSWEALENSGIKPASIRGSECGVFLGIASTDYAYRMADDLDAIDSTTATGNTLSVAANRISYVLDLHGPSMAIDTACSSSLVAFHQACRSIQSGESIQALTGGISLHIHPFGFLIFSKASMLSRRGRCSAFDSLGDGYVRSEGGGIFFLKDYDQAIADGNPILAIVANSAINTDGHKSSLTVPSHERQSDLLKSVYFQAGIDPLAIDYIEAHGTGTAVGDPIEAEALGNALGKHRPVNKPLLVGSVKSNLGHLEAASGVAGLIKALYCIQHRLVPATIGIQKINQKIPFDDLNIQVVTETKDLKKIGKVIVGVNSFGFGGANAHVILESHELENLQEACPKSAFLPILLSAKDDSALKASAYAFAAFLEEQAQSELYNIAYNTIFCRERHDHAVVVYGETPKAIAQALLNFANEVPENLQVQSGGILEAPCGPAFIYSGNGSQWAGMGGRLLKEEPLFRETIREIDAIFCRYADYSLEDELASKSGENRYEYTEIAQPALFALQVGITRLLRDRGIMPVAVAGHSVGEVAAAWASGALTLEAAVEVIYQRSRLQGTTKGKGAMTAVALGLEAVQSLFVELELTSVLTIAGINSSVGLTVAGSPEFLAKLEVALNERNIFNKRLDLDYAFHSPAMDEIETSVRQTLAKLKPGKTLIPFYSTVTGTLLNGTELDAEYWWHNIRKPVLFEQAIKSILGNQINIFIEIGPHAVLRNYINDCVKDTAMEAFIIPTVARGDDALHRIWGAFSQTVIAGASVDWQKFFSLPGAFIQLPNYSWQRERYWHPITPNSHGLLYRRKVHPLLGYPLRQHELTWENQLDTNYQYLADHVVGGATVFPGSGFAEIALAAALELHPGNLAEIEEIEIRSPLLLDVDNTKLVRTIIDSHYGSLSITARDYVGTEPFTLHAVGRIRSQPSDILLEHQEFLIPTRQPDFNDLSHNALTVATGLEYGVAFQCIAYGWIENNSALAVFKIPEIIESDLEHAHLHPAFLDCTFQLIFQLLKEDIGLHEGVAFVPSKMGRIVFRASNAKPGFARATLLRKTQRSLVAEFTVCDTDGLVIAIIKDVRFRSIRLSQNASDNLHFLDYQSTPKPLNLTIDTPSISFESTKLAIERFTKRAVLKALHRRYSEEVEPLLDSLCSQFIFEVLQQLSLDGKTLSLQEISAFKVATPEIAPFLDFLLALAESENSISLSDEGWEILSNHNVLISAQDIWTSLIYDYPDYFQIVHSVGRIGIHLKSLIEGSLTLAQIYSDESSLTKLSNLVLGAEAKHQVGMTLRNLITQGVEQLPEGRRLAILEISEGIPLFAMDAFVSMDHLCCDYIFATTSSTTIESVERLKDHFPNIDSRLIGDIAEQPKEVCNYQMAIVTLDFSSLDDALSALRYAHTCLAPGGSLIIIGQHPSRWTDFVFGGQRSNWCLSENGSWLSNHRSSQFWQLQLQQLDFSIADMFELSPDTESGPYLLLTQPIKSNALLPFQPINVKPRSWILLAEEKGYSAELSELLTKKLQLQGDLVIQASPCDIESLLLETANRYGQLNGIVHLSGLNPQKIKIEAEAVLNQQVTRCDIAASIIKASEKNLTNTTCWLVTADAATHLLPPRNHDESSPLVVMPVDGALWGFGRTLINEASNYTVRLVDFETPQLIEDVVTALYREFEQPDDEQEIILTKGGGRYAPRLQLATKSFDQEHQQIESPTLRLGFPFSGQLRKLRWEAHPRSVLADDEIEVEVHATGLNFRDVMYALGLLSDEAIENGFSGPTLGLEFSGVVRCIGSKVSGFNPGDQVVGFGPSSFGNRVVTQADAVFLIPEGISFEAAATIPCAFFTVYYALHHLARLQPGEKVLIHGAAGGVGIAAIQIAKWCGAEIYATVGSDEKRDFLHLLGVENIFNSRTLDFSDQIMTLTNGQGIDVVINSLAGGEAINRNFQILKPFGRFLELGKRDFYENTKIGVRPFRNNISYFGIDADQLMKVNPDLTRALFAEVMALFDKGILHPLPYHVFEAEDVVDAFRYMQQARQIGKIVVTYRNGINRFYTPDPVLKHLELAADASYLVTGGLSGFGLRTAEWLVDKGARNLVLISRSGPSSEEAQNAISKLENKGVKIHAVSCDITDRKAVSNLLAEITETLPPLKGIVHAATVINDGLIRNMDAEQIRRVLAPKALGAYYLHEMTLDTPLDLFILFSSATTLFGSPGQGNYVAANACLEVLAKFRRAIGLSATCISWGAIDDVGYLARNEKIKDDLQNRMGGKALDSKLALNILESMLIANSSGQGVMRFDWKVISRFLPSSGASKFCELRQHFGGDDNVNDESDDLQRLLLELSDADLLVALVDMLKSEVGEILRLSPAKINATSSIYDIGMDSLMGVELVVALESRFGIQLPVMALSQSPTITKLAERLIDQLRQGNDMKEDTDETEIISQVQQVAFVHGANNSDKFNKDLTEELVALNVVTLDRMIR
jgi:acyl transferase domain-containing protein/NADPH:quinone reductase-like Zn-dependent oxidoreductase/NADP-dependent 3-hydroxy acid dehydrogenase YdfG/acyl carrier protein